MEKSGSLKGRSEGQSASGIFSQEPWLRPHPVLHHEVAQGPERGRAPTSLQRATEAQTVSDCPTRVRFDLPIAPRRPFRRYSSSALATTRTGAHAPGALVRLWADVHSWVAF